MTTRFDDTSRAAIAGWASSRLAIVVLAALASAGCANPFSPEGTDPGVYKGKSDALFEEPADARDAALRERFELIQKR